MNAGFDAGSVRIRVRGDGAQVVAATVASQRPRMALALKGRQADDAARLLPLVFALCGRAQGVAARLAVAAARGEQALPRLDPDIMREAMREHLWRWFLDLPALFGLAPLREQFSAAVRAVDAGHEDILRGLLMAHEIMRLIEFIEAVDQPPAGAASLLRVGSAEASLADWPRLDERLCRVPTWRGRAAETGAYARLNASPATLGGAFAARWRARLAELENWAGGTQKVGAGGTASALPVAPGVGRALVETARGLLMHEVVLEHDRVAAYRIVAPTEWNFHPQGPLAGWLIGRPCADENELRKFTAQAVAALDPCVPWELTLAGRGNSSDFIDPG